MVEFRLSIKLRREGYTIYYLLLQF